MSKPQSTRRQIAALLQDAEYRLCHPSRRKVATAIVGDLRAVDDAELRFIARVGKRIESKSNPLGPWLVALCQRELLRRRVEDMSPVELSAALLDLDAFTALQLTEAWQTVMFGLWTGISSPVARRFAMQLTMQLSCALRARLLTSKEDSPC